MLWDRVLDASGLGSSERASEDSVRYVLKRRLPTLDPGDHLRYVELDCRRLVKTLRLTRDVYRACLENEGCKPVAEMHWIVFRFAVMPYSVKLLREAASAYIIYSRVAELDWQAMYGYSPAAIIQVPPELKEFTKPSPSIQETITALINEESFQQISRGGPFGKDGQIRLARSRPATTFRMEDMSLLDTIKMRQTLWEKNYPWTEGLARLFDATQEELLYQNEVLSRDGRRAEAQFVSLSAFEKIAHKHLIDIRQKDVRSRNLGHGAWLELLRGLDAQKIPLDGQLRNKAKNVLDEVRRNGHKVHLWEDCYSAKLRASLDDGKIYNLRREVTHAIHNAAKKAQYQLSKIWRTR